MKKIVIIPAYNEEASILMAVNDVLNSAKGYDCIVINDGSKDNTALVCKNHKIECLNLSLNLGIGGAVQTGYKYALKNGYDIAVQFDGDGQHDAKYLDLMEQQLVNKSADMIIGSRFIEREGFQSTGLRRFAIKYFTILIKILTGTKITDPTSGYRMCNRTVIELFSKSYPKDYPEPETLISVLKDKKIAEIPVKMRAREQGVSTISPLKSVYYMIKVSLAILIEITRKKAF